MRKYRVLTIANGASTREFVALGSHAYGEWILYEEEIPKYHVDIFREHSRSDTMVKRMLDEKGMTIASIVEGISKLRCINVHTGKLPETEQLILNSELKEKELVPLPEDWVDELDKNMC